MPIDYDSILTATGSNVINSTEFYQQGITLPDRTVPMQELNYVVSGDDYVVAGMILLFCMLATVFHKGKSMLLYRLKDFFTTKRQYREDYVSDSVNEVICIFLLIVISALSLSLVFFDDYFELYHNPVDDVPYWLLGAGAIACFAFVYIKAGIYSLVNWVFFDPEANTKWMSSYFLMTALTAFFFYPVALIDVFFDDRRTIATAVAILIGIVYEILLFYRLFTNFKAKKYGYLLIFLYFCSVEIMPVLVLWRVVGWLNDNVIVENIIY